VAVSTRSAVISGGSLTLFLALVHATNDAFTSMLAALLPSLQLRFGVGEAVLASFVAMLSFSSSMMQPFFGVLADRLGRRLIGALGVIGSSSLLSLMGIAPTPVWLFGLLLVGGLGSAAFHPAATSLARSLSSNRGGLAVAVFSAGGSLGVALGPIVVLYVVSNHGLAATPWLMVPGVLLGLLLFLLPSGEVPVSRRQLKFFDRALLFGPVGKLVVVGVLRTIPFITFVNAMPLWLGRAWGLSADSPLIGWTLAVFSVAVALGGIAAGALAVRWSVSRVLVWSIVMALPALSITLLLVPGSVWYFFAVAAAGALLGPGLPLLVVSAQDLAPHAVATASGLIGGTTAGVAGLLYIGVGVLQSTLGLGPAIAISYLCLVPSAFLTRIALPQS
jgi:FSR family fosmidomycin resistance protein-like MFS transporter